MRLIEIKALENGGHRNQTIDHLPLSKIPSGWAIIPDFIRTENFPYGEVTVEEINGVMTVTSWTPGVIPEPVALPKPEPKADELIDILLGVEADE